MEAVAGSKSKYNVDRGELDHGRERLAEVDVRPLDKAAGDLAVLVFFAFIGRQSGPQGSWHQAAPRCGQQGGRCCTSLEET